MTATPDAAAALAWRTPFLSLATLDESNGYPEARVLFNLRQCRASVFAGGPAALANPMGTWLGTNTSSRKVRHVRRDPRVCLSYADTETFEGLSLQGTVTEVLDPAIRAAIWTPDWERFYRGGLDGGDFTVLHFAPERGRYYHGLTVIDFDAHR